MTEPKVRVVYSKQFNPWLNLAVEEYLLNKVTENEVILYLWQNKNTVVIGRNQNAWRECATKLLEKEGGVLSRRLSGGGAVYHDLGNLNFTFIAGKNLYDLDKQYMVLLDAVKEMDIPAEMTGRNDLVAGGRKFSGNAFCHRRNGSYHHGTILVNVDMPKLSRYLRVSAEKMKAKGVKSVVSRVVNLTEFVPDLTIDQMMDSLRKSFEKHYGKAQIVTCGFDDFDSKVINDLYNRYSSWDWLYGEAPDFDLEISDKFQWGEIQFHFKLSEGYIKKATIYSDSMDEEFILALPECFENKRLGSNEIILSLNNNFNDAKHNEQVSDIIGIMENRDL